jgi:hypothetical protein
MVFDMSALTQTIKIPAKTSIQFWNVIADQCPLLGVKRTPQIAAVVSAYDPKRT